MNYRTERLPIVTLSLIGLNTLVFLVTLIASIRTGGESNFWVMENLWLIPAESHWWTFITSVFVHGGILHLVGNMLFLFLFGCCVEDMIGRARFTIMYLSGGLFAALAYIAFSPEHFASEIPMGGASGAISACMGMYLLLRADAKIDFKYLFWLFVFVRAGEFELPAWIAIGFWFLKDLISMLIGIFSHHHGGGVAFGAHVGGLLAGIAMIGIHKFLSRSTKIAEMIPEPAASPVPVAIARTRAPIRVRLRSSSAMANAPGTVVDDSPEIATGEISPLETPSIFLHVEGEQRGPFTLSQVQGMLRLGSIGPDALYWSEGMSEWENIADLSDHPG
ncbi:MAG TPA: rhomboid family intramembrane serine protease [Verrucomicrobiae bacterium]|nr:rhomboid family intramembrane serine protease [Verrucomicrobiae bacterium]